MAKCDFKRHKERKMSYSLNHPASSPFYRVVCTCWVYNTVLWWFSWWYLYFCIHFGDPVISGFYKPRLFLKLALTLDSLFSLLQFKSEQRWNISTLQTVVVFSYRSCGCKKLCWVSLCISLNVHELIFRVFLWLFSLVDGIFLSPLCFE